MSVVDSKYTSPDAIRTLYLNPRNPLQNIEDVNQTQLLTAASLSQAISVSSAPTGQVGGLAGGSHPGCPAVDQWTMARVPNSSALLIKRVQDLIVDEDFLWNRVIRKFQRVIKAEIIKDVECVEYSTFHKTKSVVSYSHPVIRDRADRKGTAISELIAQPDESHRTLALLDDDLVDTEIESIVSAGKHDVVWITVEGEGGGIYFCGSEPWKLNGCHNKALENPGDILFGEFDS